MNFPSRILLFLLAGAAAGLLVVFLTDVTGILRITDQWPPTKTDLSNTTAAAVCFGGFLGALFGVANNLASGTRDWVRAVGFGLGIGVAAGFVGITFGMAVFAPLYVEKARNPLAFLGNVIARGLGWCFIGALAGTAEGWRKQSVRVGRNGLIGGAIGGLLGGAVFEIAPYLMPGVRAGAVSRTLGFVITGAMIGLFIALVQEWLKEAWVKIQVGRNEFSKEILLEKAESKIGRNELCDIPLFGNPQIGRSHALLVALPSGGYVVRDTGESPIGVLVNGAKVTSEQKLRSGDQIQIVDRVLVFFEKQVRQRTVLENRDVKQAPAIPVAQPGVSPYALNPSSNPSSNPSPGPFPAAGKGSRLVVVSGPHSGQSFALQAGLVFGRDPGNSAALPADTKASRRHAQLVTDGGGVALEDLGSTNGTFVNGQRITRVALAPGDQIVIGSTTLRVE
ncbi:FHA domain-containing protein [Armatimonas sp.]|uniref:FHA domain-containing protein n=1 Tax=Armatimonas sp. TaxID=1872638 RepID=UPI00374D3E06